MLTVNEGRFLDDLHRLASVGVLDSAHGGGRDRRAFSLAEREARRLFSALAKDAGLHIRTDAAGNVFARLPSSAPDAPTLLVGSHMDTVPNGGPYDGALGVIAGLEVLRILQESGENLPVTLECVAFTDEEGRYCGLTGSQLAAGTYSREATERFHLAASHYQEDIAAMREFLPADFAVDNSLASRLDTDRILAFLELHIEQGPQLEQAQTPIGIVDAIFGRVSCQVRFTGRSDHAGTTPMSLRADALQAAARFMVHMNSYVVDSCPGAVLTCGNLTVTPGADNVVPAEARIWLEYRANTPAMLDAIGSEVDASLELVSARTVTEAQVEDHHRLDPRPMHPAVQKAIADSCTALGYPSMTFSSGALHDAHSMAAVVPAGMIFVPSIGGRSHCPQENTEPVHLIAGATVLLHAVRRLAQHGLSA